MIVLSVYIIAVSGLIPALFNRSISSSALCIATCSAWLWEHRFSRFTYFLVIMFLSLYITTSDPTPP